MASDVVSEAIKAHLDTNWTATAIQYENEPAIQTTDRNGKMVPFIAVEYTGNIYGQQSIGESIQANNRWDEEGKLFIHVFVPSGTGGKLARQYAKAAADLFRGRTLLANNNLEFMDASIGLGEVGDELGKTFRISVEILFRRWDA